MWRRAYWLVECLSISTKATGSRKRSTDKPIGLSPQGSFLMSLYFPTDAEQTRREIFPGVTIATCAAEKMMLSYVELAPNAVVAEHSHPHEQVGMVVEGSALFVIGGEEKVLKKSDRYLIPGNVKHHVTALADGCVALDIFCPVREDYR